ncbi:MAG: DUF2357 domain-containing protein [Polyangia bacterium]
MRFFDRLTERMVPDPGPDPWLGRWVLADRNGELVVQNGVDAEAGDFLVPDRRGAFLVEAPGGRSVQGQLAKGQAPAPLDADGLHELGERLRPLGATPSPWLDWLSVPPLVPGLSERAKLQPIEIELADGLTALAHVCACPRAHLKSEVERLPIHRARRMPPRAIGHLAAHSEDWEYLTLCSVRPRRILSVVREEELDIYENRVVARLIDVVATYLSQRICEVETIRRTFQQVSNYSHDAASGSHHRQRRVFKLWGQHADANEGLVHAQRTIAELERMYREIVRLQGSALYRSVPRRAEVPLALRPSNLFAHDAMYRTVARLWLRWSKLAGAQPLSASLVYRRNQELCENFVDFLALLLVHALEQLGYEPQEPDVPWGRGVTIELTSAWGTARVRWLERGSFLIEEEGAERPLLRIVPILAHLGRPGSAQEPRPEGAAVAGAPTLVAYLGGSADTPERERTAGLSFWQCGLPGDNASDWGGVSLAPWNLGSVERMARALRSVLLSRLFVELPPRIPVAPQEVGARIVMADALRSQADGKTCLLCRPLTQAELDRLARCVAEQQLVRDGLARKVEEAAELQSASKDDRRGLGEANRQKTLLRHELNEAEQALQRLQIHVQDIERGQRRIEQALRCPVCPNGRERLTGRMEVNLDGTFRVICQECGASWDTRSCICCQRRFATLWPKLSVALDCACPGWIDDQLGCDVLALPCPQQGLTKPGFHCPHCGGCVSCTQRAGSSVQR